MNTSKFNSLFDFLQAFPTEESCIKYLEAMRWKDGIPVSPYDPSSNVYNRGTEITDVRIRARILMFA